MRTVYLNTINPDDLLIKRVLYQNRILLVRQITTKRLGTWLNGYLEIKPGDKIDLLLDRQKHNLAPNLREITFEGQVIINDEKLNNLFIGFDNAEPIYKHETVDDVLNDLKAYLQYGRYFKVEKNKDGKI